jgi:hypothetical protein
MPIFRRKGAIKSKPTHINLSGYPNTSISTNNSNSNITGKFINDSGVDSSSDSEDMSKEEEYINEIFSTPEDKKMLDLIRKSIVYIYIRAHSALPFYNTLTSNIVGITGYFETYKMPSDMNLIKITAALNGETNCSFYDYTDKKQLIIEGIRENMKPTNSDINNRVLSVAKSIQSNLREFEIKNNIKKSNERNIISNEKVVLNKVIERLSDKEIKSRPGYIAIQLMFFDEDNDEFISIELYDYIYNIYREHRKIVGNPKAIRIADIIKFLYEYMKVKQVVLIDFSCSSYSSSNLSNNNKNRLTQNINNKNLHGGKSKLRYNKTKKTKNTNKKLNKYKSKANRKTKTK